MSKKAILNYANPNYYIGEHLECQMGYATQPESRVNVSSGGLITNLLCNMLRHGDIGGAWVTKTAFENNKITYHTFIATTESEIRGAASSVYINVPMLKHLNVLEKYKGDGKIAVIMVPCMLRAFSAILEKRPHLKEKVALKIGLYCSGTVQSSCVDLALQKAGVTAENATRLYFKRGHWRGMSSVIYDDGSEKSFSYTKFVCAYKNAFFFAKKSCLQCQDQYAECSDISFGDVWLKEMKQQEIKHTCCVIRTEKAKIYMEQAVSDDVITLEPISDIDIVRSQKRALVFKFLCPDNIKKRKWNHRLAYYLAKKNQKMSVDNYKSLEKIPSVIIYYYMCFIRVLLSF